MIHESRLSVRMIMVLSATAVLVILTFALTSALPQDPAYHQFADTRAILGVGNFYNVISNLPLLIIGIVGLAYLASHAKSVCSPGLLPAYIVFFVGIFLTAFGSSYYHLSPANGPLVWDRLSMAISLAGLFTLIIGEFVSSRFARRILAPFVLIGIGSVAYWAVTEVIGAGDLRPYAMVQFLPLMLIAFILLSYRPAIGSSKYYWLMMLFYVVAKVFEHFDAAIFSAGQIISGHTLKHLFASLMPATLLYALTARRRT